MAATARLARIPAGTSVFREGDAGNHYILVLEGSIKVQKATGDGHEIVLYHVEPGQTCALTACSLLSDNRLTASAIAETALTLVRIPKRPFLDALDQSPPLRQFVYRSIDGRVTELISVIETVAFVPTHERLGGFLLTKMSGQNQIHLTHQELANELGTAREVVSRLLKEFEHHGWVKLHRGWIEITNATSLQNIAT
ncbi:MAG: CRP/FNR family transcriptional regulator anaerobic regulatory protein [Gammaproteobacteria bacterium]|nr:MAG: CRP/FNR family transcriptional regulator anaerobic regulatory protein [Gammaproteobacteria bacterium]TND07078.1 MAG: CRP/FNR family transcriptional regulator, anaerobic regulatory protein [Gammaproteobacteria bacterium]